MPALDIFCWFSLVLIPRNIQFSKVGSGGWRIGRRLRSAPHLAGCCLGAAHASSGVQPGLQPWKVLTRLAPSPALRKTRSAVRRRWPRRRAPLWAETVEMESPDLGLEIGGVALAGRPTPCGRQKVHVDGKRGTDKEKGEMRSKFGAICPAVHRTPSLLCCGFPPARWHSRLSRWRPRRRGQDLSASRPFPNRSSASSLSCWDSHDSLRNDRRCHCYAQ